MFLLTLSKGDKQGRCRINGKEAEYQLLDNPTHGPYIIWRYADPEESRHWDRRNVLSSEEITDANDVPCTSYMCDDGQSPDERPACVIVKPSGFGGIVTEIHSHTTLAKLLPIQDHYYVLAHGNQWARFGPDAEHVGVLVFADQAKAERFLESVAFHQANGEESTAMGIFNPKKLTADALCDLVEVVKTICVVDDLGGVTLATVTIDSEETIERAAGEGVADD